MQNLKDFYLQKVCEITTNDRYVAIQQIEDVIVVNFDTVFDRECTIRGIDQLIYLLHKQGSSCRFLFISEDGANIQLSGALTVIKNIIECFDLTAETCCVACREKFTIPNCTVVTIHSVEHWCKFLYPTIKEIPIPTGDFSKKFAAWFHRGTFYRLELAKHLKENYAEDSYISYQESGIIADRNLRKHFDTEWADKNTPIVYDMLFPKRMYDYNMIVGPARKPYNDYFIELVAETDILSSDWITEKTVKNLYIGKPFILMCAPRSLQKLRGHGFRTFSPWIDESYDNIDNIHQRLEAIKKEVDRLASKSYEELHQMHLEMMPTFNYNRNVYEYFARR
jgi:hypothetical protein